jgi:hypothetical protein
MTAFAYLLTDKSAAREEPIAAIQRDRLSLGAAEVS